MLLFLLNALRSVPLSDPWLLSPDDDSAFPVNAPIPVIFARPRISKLLSRHSQHEIICQIDRSFVEVYELSLSGELLVPTNNFLPGSHTLKIGVRSPDGVYHWKDSRTIRLLSPPTPSSPPPSAPPPLAKLPLADGPLSIEVVTSFLGKFVPVQLNRIPVTVKVSYAGRDSITVQGKLNCENATDDWTDIASGIAVGQPVTVILPLAFFANFNVRPRIVWFDVRAVSDAGQQSELAGVAFELIIEGPPRLKVVAPATLRFPEIVIENVQNQSALFAISGTLLVPLYLEYAFGFNPTRWVRLQTVAPGPDVRVDIPASVWKSGDGRALSIRSSSLKFRVSDGYQLSKENVWISYGTIHETEPPPIAPILTVQKRDLGNLTPAALAQVELLFSVKYRGRAPVSVDVAIWEVFNRWITLYRNVSIGEELVKPVGDQVSKIFNLTRAGRYQLVIRAIANGFSSTYQFVDFNFVIPEAPVLSLVSPLGGLGPLEKEYLGGEKLLFSLTDSDSGDNVAIEFQISGTGNWVREPVKQGYFVEVVIPARAWVGAATEGVIQFRGTDGTYYSEALISVGYSLYNSGAVGLSIVTAPDAEIFEGDPATFEFSFVDAASHSLTLSYARMFGKTAGPRVVLLEKVAPAPSVYVTVPANAFMYDSKGKSRALCFILSDGVNESNVTFNYILAGGVTLTDTTRGTYFGPLPTESDPPAIFQYLIRSNDLIIRLEYAFPEQGQKLVWKPWAVVTPTLVSQAIPFPNELWLPAPAQPGFHQFAVQAVAEHGSDYINYTYLAPSKTSPTVRITAEKGGELGRFYLGIVPAVSIQVALSGVQGRLYVLSAAVGNRSVTVVNVVPGQQAVAIPGAFWKTQAWKAGPYSIPFFVGELRNGKVVDCSNLQVLSYTVADGLLVGDGQLSVLYSGTSELLKVPALRTEVKVPLKIKVQGYHGIGPFRLEYSVASPPVWNVYPGAVGTGGATYSLPRALVSGAPHSQLLVRVSRNFVGSSTANISLMSNVPPVLQLLRPADGDLGKVYERPITEPSPLSALFNLTDAGDILTLTYAVDDGPEVAYTSLEGQTSIELKFLREILDLSLGTHAIVVRVSDSIESSVPVLLRYEVIASPKIAILSPRKATWSTVTLSSPLSLAFTVQTVQNENVKMEYRIEGNTGWGLLSGEVRPGKPYKISVPTAVLTGSAASDGLHYIAIRATSSTQYSEDVPVWYCIGAVPETPPDVLLAGDQKSIVNVPSVGPDARQRKVSLVIRDVGNAGILRLDYKAGLANLTTYGHFPAGPTTVTLPVELFLGGDLNGSSVSVIFSAFDGISRGSSATVTYFVNQPPSFTLDPPGPLTFPASGPREDVKVRLAISDPDSTDFVVKYRFDDDPDWRTSRRVRHQVFTRDSFNAYLSFTRTHRLYILVSDGIENATKFIEYKVARPVSRVGPTIRLPPGQADQRFRSVGPLVSQRKFDLTVTNPISGFIYIEFAVDNGPVGDARGYPGNGSYVVTVPEGFFAPALSPGGHRIVFKASDGFAANSVVSRYYVNTPPTMAIVSPKSDVTFAPNTANPLTVVLALADADKDPLTIQYRFDANAVWSVARANFSGAQFTWNLVADWAKPYLSLGFHRVRFQASDGLENSQTVVVNYRVTNAEVPLDVEGGVEEGEEEGWIDFSVGTLPGLAIGVGITVMAAVIAAVVVRYKLKRRRWREEKRKETTTSSSVDQGAPIKVP